MAPRCQHTCSAVLLRVFDNGDLLGVDVAATDDSVPDGDTELRPHVSRPSSDEPARDGERKTEFVSIFVTVIVDIFRLLI